MRAFNLNEKKAYFCWQKKRAMAKNLVIVESPAKAKTIEKFLGKDYKVASSFGHIADLPSRSWGLMLRAIFYPNTLCLRTKRKWCRS